MHQTAKKLVNATGFYLKHLASDLWRATSGSYEHFRLFRRIRRDGTLVDTYGTDDATCSVYALGDGTRFVVREDRCGITVKEVA